MRTQGELSEATVSERERRDGTHVKDTSGHTVHRDPTASRPARVPAGASRATPLLGDHVLDHVEAVARLGSYSLDIGSERWVSSRGLDAILGLDAGFERSIEGWLSLVHPDDRDAMAAYFTDEVLGRTRPFDRQYRIVRADTGEERWVHGRGTLELDASGRPLRMLGTIADVTVERRAQEALIASELRYAAIFEGTAEAILIADAETARIRMVNGTACALFGYPRDEFLGMTITDLHPQADLPAILDQFHAMAAGRITVARSIPCLRRDGTVILADIKASQVVLDGVACNIGFFVDVTESRRLEAHDRKLAEAAAQTTEAIVITGPTAEIEYINPAFERLSRLRSNQLVGGHPSLLGSPQDPAVIHEMWRTVSTGGSWAGDLIHRRPDGTDRIAAASISPVRAADGTITGYVAVERDVTDERAHSAERKRLQTAVEQASDAVIITDLDGTIDYVNPAFERMSGYGRDEAVGRNPRILKSGRQSAAFYRAVWRRLARGEPWSGRFSNRRADGGLYEVEATISPISGSDGEVAGYIGVQRDVTDLLAARSNLATAFRERAAVTAALARLQPRESAEATAAVICDELAALPGVDIAALISFLDPTHATALAAVGPVGLPLDAGRPLPTSRATYLHGRAEQGPWAEAWAPRPADGEYGEAMAAIGTRAIAYAPIRNGEGLLGVIAVGTTDEAYAAHFIEHLPIVGEFAATASALLASELERGRRRTQAHDHITRIMSEHAFGPVFQPIVELGSDRPVGYEALTRFDDRTPPDRVFAEAARAGLGVDLEIAAMAAALRASDALPGDVWLSLNASPEVILEGRRLAAALSGRSRRIALEITEHVVIDDYKAVRRAIARLGPDVSLAVDDAGAGFASLRHVVELKPRYLKLDVALIRGVDSDLTRQAMVAGLTHFATRAGCEVIAEGIEHSGEREILRELGVGYGQGYLLGRPASIAGTARPGSD